MVNPELCSSLKQNGHHTQAFTTILYSSLGGGFLKTCKPPCNIKYNIILKTLNKDLSPHSSVNGLAQADLKACETR